MACFDQNLAEARAGFADLTNDEIEGLIEEAVTATRAAHALDAA